MKKSEHDLGIIAATTIIITFNIMYIYETPLKSFRYAAFQVASVITTTGFATADYNLWPESCRSVYCSWS